MSPGKYFHKSVNCAAHFSDPGKSSRDDISGDAEK
jgi:hypothetical protein